jgi:hypothetical protein
MMRAITSLAIGTYECTPALVALPDLLLDRLGNIARVGLRTRLPGFILQSEIFACFEITQSKFKYLLKARAIGILMR